MEPVEQDVAVQIIALIAAAHPVFQQDVAGQPELCRGGRRLAGVIGLRRALRDDRIRSEV